MWQYAASLYDGQLHHGNGWVTSPIPGGRDGPASVAVGQPDQTQVIRIDPSLPDGALGFASVWHDEEATSGFGSAVLVQPDPENPGEFDLWVGSPEHRDKEGLARGAVFLFRDAHDHDRVRASEADVVLYGTTEGDRFGAELTLCTDLDDDGLPEIIVGAPWFQTPDPASVDGETFEEVPDLAGAIYVLRSRAVSPLTESRVSAWDYSTVWWGTEEGEAAGQAVTCGPLDPAVAGEDTIAVGAPWARNRRGVVYLMKDLLGGEVVGDDIRWRSLSSVVHIELRGEENNGWFGASLMTLRMAAEEERSLLAVGSPGREEGEGGVTLFDGAVLSALYGGEAKAHNVGALEPPYWFRPVPIPDESSHFGQWLYAPDVDADGLADLVVGAPDHKGPATRDFDTGRVWIWYGKYWGDWDPFGLEAADVLLTGSAPFQRIGRSLSFVDTHDNEGPGDDGWLEVWVPTSWASAGP